MFAQHDVYGTHTLWARPSQVVVFVADSLGFWGPNRLYPPTRVCPLQEKLIHNLASRLPTDHFLRRTEAQTEKRQIQTAPIRNLAVLVYHENPNFQIGRQECTFGMSCHGKKYIVDQETQPHQWISVLCVWVVSPLVVVLRLCQDLGWHIAKFIAREAPLSYAFACKQGVRVSKVCMCGDMFWDMLQLAKQT